VSFQRRKLSLPRCVGAMPILPTAPSGRVGSIVHFREFAPLPLCRGGEGLSRERIGEEPRPTSRVSRRRARRRRHERRGGRFYGLLDFQIPLPWYARPARAAGGGADRSRPSPRNLHNFAGARGATELRCTITPARRPHTGTAAQRCAHRIPRRASAPARTPYTAHMPVPWKLSSTLWSMLHV
jgi:hypothetical protein